ncbi:hypothetical protein EDC94DRAFT_603562 [Helicostylum pulchrum]|uniref:Hexosyltransferase n=1 Tax=Helicostylum pulchrum TaxID=562976 RepID=A0ABP9YEW6_9FUNG|nr:hypothetical protein EDC94DRAFT_603562 [Helicostylum pulchrum]
MDIQQKILNSLKCVFTLVTIYTMIYVYKCNAPNLGQPLQYNCSSNSISSIHPINQTKVLIGIFSTTEKFMRRKMIRETYLQHKPSNLDYKFIIAAPAPNEILLNEMGLYNDIMVLDMPQENMNKGKTFEFFRSVAERQEYRDLDFVLKADDDAYLRLDRIKYDLAHTVRNMTYWGYLVGNTFMAGQCYGLSMDLVRWVANSSISKKYKFGHEDSQLQKWFQWSNINHQVKYEVRNCRIHDHVNSRSVYAREIDTNSSMVVHGLKKDHFFMTVHYALT